MAQVTKFDDTIISFMRQHGAEKIGVFGSYARNEAGSTNGMDDEAFMANRVAGLSK
jgi:uncharacterized protein